MFQDSGTILSKKFFSDFQTNLSPDIVMRSQRQKLPHTCNQRRQTLSVRITSKGDWSLGVSLRCESVSLGQKIFLSSGSAGFPVGSQAQCTWGRTSVGQDVSGAGRHGAEHRGAGGQWGRMSWGRTSLGQYPWGRTSWGRRSVGQDVVGQNFVGQDVTGAISLGQNVVGQEVSGAGRRGAELRGAGRHWGNFLGAGGQWGRRFWGRK